MLVVIVILQDTRREPHVRRDGNLPHATKSQEGELHQTRLLPPQLLLLPLPVRASPSALNPTPSTVAPSTLRGVP